MPDSQKPREIAIEYQRAYSAPAWYWWRPRHGINLCRSGTQNLLSALPTAESNGRHSILA